MANNNINNQPTSAEINNKNQTQKTSSKKVEFSPLGKHIGFLFGNLFRKASTYIVPIISLIAVIVTLAVSTTVSGTINGSSTVNWLFVLACVFAGVFTILFFTLKTLNIYKDLETEGLERLAVSRPNSRTIILFSKLIVLLILAIVISLINLIAFAIGLAIASDVLGRSNVFGDILGAVFATSLLLSFFFGSIAALIAFKLSKKTAIGVTNSIFPLLLTVALVASPVTSVSTDAYSYYYTNTLSQYDNLSYTAVDGYDNVSVVNIDNNATTGNIATYDLLVNGNGNGTSGIAAANDYANSQTPASNEVLRWLNPVQSVLETETALGTYSTSTVGESNNAIPTYNDSTVTDNASATDGTQRIVVAQPNTHLSTETVATNTSNTTTQNSLTGLNLYSVARNSTSSTNTTYDASYLEVTDDYLNVIDTLVNNETFQNDLATIVNGGWTDANGNTVAGIIDNANRSSNSTYLPYYSDLLEVYKGIYTLDSITTVADNTYYGYHGLFNTAVSTTYTTVSGQSSQSVIININQDEYVNVYSNWGVTYSSGFGFQQQNVSVLGGTSSTPTTYTVTVDYNPIIFAYAALVIMYSHYGEEGYDNYTTIINNLINYDYQVANATTGSTYENYFSSSYLNLLINYYDSSTADMSTVDTTIYSASSEWVYADTSSGATSTSYPNITFYASNYIDTTNASTTSGYSTTGDTPVTTVTPGTDALIIGASTTSSTSSWYPYIVWLVVSLVLLTIAVLVYRRKDLKE